MELHPLLSSMGNHLYILLFFIQLEQKLQVNWNIMYKACHIFIERCGTYAQHSQSSHYIVELFSSSVLIY